VHAVAPVNGFFEGFDGAACDDHCIAEGMEIPGKFPADA
jgi:hypothetical protein